MNETTAAAEIVRDLTTQATRPHRLDLGSFYALVTPHGTEKIDLTGDGYRDFPQRKRGTVAVTDVASFALYHQKHSDDDSEVFADLDAGTVTAVLDAHGGTAAAGRGESGAVRWQQHRLILQLRHTEPWLAWTGRDGRLMRQADFAEFIEDHARDVIAPDPKAVTSADLLEIAQSFQAHTSVEFKSGHRIASGQTQLTYVENTEAKAQTARGTIEIPNEFSLGIKPFEDCEPMVIRARFRYRLAGGDLTLGFRLDDAAGTARRAVQEVTDKLAATCGADVMYGRPA